MTQLDGFKIVVKENIVSKLKKFCIIWSNLQDSDIRSSINLWLRIYIPEVVLMIVSISKILDGFFNYLLLCVDYILIASKSNWR